MTMIPIKLVLNQFTATDNIFILCAIIDKQRCISKPLYTCFVDFTKAFDYIDRTALYYKLLNRGIDGSLRNIIKNMFSKAECRVKLDSYISDISEFGSPKLFTVFLQDNYPHHLAKIKVSLWAPYQWHEWYIYYLQMTLFFVQNMLRDYKNS